VPRNFVRYHWTQDDTWSHVELDVDGHALRQVDLRGPHLKPMSAACLAEVLYIRDHQDRDAMSAYEAQYGVLSEGSWDGWRHYSQAGEITEMDFEMIWSAARRALGPGRRT